MYPSLFLIRKRWTWFTLPLCVVLIAAFLLLPTYTYAAMQPSLPAQQADPSTTGPTRQPYIVTDPNAYIYTVCPGDYWTWIAQRFGVSYEALREANAELWKLRGAVIQPGDEIIIPGLPAPTLPDAQVYTVQRGDSWYKISQQFGVSFYDLRLDNAELWRRRGTYLRTGDEVKIPSTQAVAAGAVTEEPSAETTTSTASPDSPASTGPGAPIRVTSVPSGMIVYTVRPGETWFGIAAAYGLNFAQLRTMNPRLWTARGQALRVSDQMLIPANARPTPPDIRTGEDEAETPPAADSATQAEVVPTQAPVTPAASTESAPGDGSSSRIQITLPEPKIVYVVLEGENWATLAAKSGFTEAELRAANSALAGRDLRPGDQVSLP